MKKLFSFLLIVICSSSAVAQNKQIIIETATTSLVLSVGSNQRVTQSYFGKKITNLADYAKLGGGREVYLTAGMENQNEPAIRMVHNDGNPSLELKYVSHSTTTDNNISTTAIITKDPVYPVEVILFYKSFFNENVITSWTTIKHQEKKPVLLTEYASSILHFNEDKYFLTQFYGDWAREVQMKEEELTNGIKTLESKLGTRTNFYQTQAFFVSLNEPSTETTGETI